MPIRTDDPQYGRYAEPYIEKLLEFLSDPNIEALGEGIEGATRGVPTPSARALGGVGSAMVFGSKAMAKTDPAQLKRFLGHLGDLASGKKPRKWKTEDVLDPEEEFARLYSEARRTPATANLEPFSNKIPERAPGQFGAFDLNPQAGFPGATRGRVRIAGPGTTEGKVTDPLTQRIMGIAHELRHGAENQRSNPGDPNWFRKQLHIPYSWRPTELKARGAEPTALNDFNRFMETIEDPAVYDKLTGQDKRVADAFRMAKQSGAQKELVGVLPGYTKEKAQGLMQKAWDMLDPQAQSRRDLLQPQAAQAAGQGPQARYLGRAARGGYEHGVKGSIITNEGKVHRLDSDDVHGLARRTLNLPSGKGFETRGGSVRILQESGLTRENRPALEKAVELALKDGAQSPFLAISTPGAGYTSFPKDQAPFFLADPKGFLAKARYGRTMAGRSMKPAGSDQGLTPLMRKAMGLDKKVAKEAAGFGQGTLVTLDGKVHGMKKDQWHSEVAEVLQRKKQEFRGFQVRPADIIVPDAEFLNNKAALKKALISARDLAKKWNPTDVSVKLQGLDNEFRTKIIKDAVVPLDQFDEFIKNPRKWLKDIKDPWANF
jgi:hypothetical protein